MLNFKIALTSVPWDSAYNNTLQFDSRVQQRGYFNIPHLFNGAQSVNFNIGSLLHTTVRVNSASISLVDLMGKNYAIVWDMRTGAEYPYYYYFIDHAEQLSGNVLELTITLDVIQTYYPDLEFSPCMINRCHYPPFYVPSGFNQDRLMFNNAPDSPFLDINGTNLPKRLIKRDTLFIPPDGSEGLSTGSKFCQDHNIVWAFWVIANVEAINDVPFFTANGISTGYKVLCAPLNLSGSAFTIKFSDNVQWKFSDANEYMQTIGTSTSEAVAYFKITPICPVSWNNMSGTLDASGLTLTLSYSSTSAPVEKKVIANKTLFFLRNQAKTPRTVRIRPYWNNFPSTSSPTKFDDEPISLNPYYKEICIKDYAGNTFNIDLQKLNCLCLKEGTTKYNQFKVNFYEFITGSTTKTYITVEDNSSWAASTTAQTVYQNGQEFNFSGLVTDNDTQLPFSYSQLSSFWANNKNFSLIQQAQRDYKKELYDIETTQRWLKFGADSLSTAASSGSAAAAGMKILGSATDNIITQMGESQRLKSEIRLSKIEENATLDNMRARPWNVKNAQGNILFDLLVAKNNKLSYYVEYYAPLDQDVKKVHDYIKMFGYNYGIIGDIKTAANYRTRYNYVEAELENVNFKKALSNEVKEIFKAIFKNGIRFWTPSQNTSKQLFNYDAPNPQRNL